MKLPPVKSTTRFPVERMQRIIDVIQAGRQVTATTLAREFGVSAKTVHRDIEFLRDRLRFAMTFDYQVNAWVKGGVR